MGIYDREHYRSEYRGGPSSFTPNTVVGTIIAINVIIWLVDYFVFQGGLSETMAVHEYTIRRPWLWWEFLTSAFAHSPTNYTHILFNMMALFFLGPDVEEAYGSREFLRIFLATALFASVVWNVLNLGDVAPTMVIGASGAISGVVVLYALNFPRRTLLMFFVIPMPAWLVGVIIVCMDMLGATGNAGESNIAYTMHLAGAAFALLYYQLGWNFGRLSFGRFRLPKFPGSGPKLRVHNPPPEDAGHSDLTAEVDRILEKIYRDGEASLTPKERKTLETASREFQRRKGH